LKLKIGLILLSLSIILSLTVNELAFASHDSKESLENIQAGCREGNVLVFRLSSHEYLCTSSDTAKRWVELGLAEIIQNATIQPAEPQTPVQVPKIEPAPAKNTPINDNSQCREGYTLVFRFTHKDTFCTSPSTAASWVKLGLAEIIQEATISVKKETIITKVNEEINSKNTTKGILPNTVSPKKNIDIPSFPKQPVINSELLKLNDYRYPPAIHQVNDRIWVAVGYDSANSVMIEGEKGIIIINTLSSSNTAKKVIDEFRKITTKPVKAIIYTSGNSEDIGGTNVFLEQGDEKVEIISHDNNLNFYVKQNIMLNKFTGLRSYYTSGSLLSSEDQTNSKYFIPLPSDGIHYVPPTNTFSDKFNLNISGVKMNLGHMGDTSEQIYVWLPDDQSLFIGDNLHGIFPNTSVLSGIEYHDPMRYVTIIDEFIPLSPQSLILSHVKPVIGTENVRNFLVLTRDVTQYIHDQTIRGINNGYRIDELSNMIKLPSTFDKHPWFTYSENQIQWNVKQIYYGTIGWFEEDPVFLHPVNFGIRSSKIVNGFGGIDNVLHEVKIAMKNDEYEWASELATYVLYADPENSEAKLLKAHALRVLGQRILSADARHLELTKALELEGKIEINNYTKLNYEQLSKVPIEELLSILPTKLNSSKADNINAVLNIFYSDVEKEFAFNFRNNILTITEGSDKDARYALNMDTAIHKSIITGDLKLVDIINSKLIESKGNKNNILYLMGLIQEDDDGMPMEFDR